MSEFHHSVKWQRTRKRARRKACGVCANPWGVHRDTRVADCIHHLIPVEACERIGRADLKNNASNLIALCSDCHKKAHKRRFCGSDGYWSPFGGIEAFLGSFNGLEGMGSEISKGMVILTTQHFPQEKMRGIFGNGGSFKIRNGILESKGKNGRARKKTF